MEKAQIQERIENAAAQHGFSVKYAGRDWLPDIVSENMNFILLGQTDPTSDWKSGRVRVNIMASASVSRMGGDPTPDELLQTADEIRRGAELLRELQNAGLSYIVNV